MKAKTSETIPGRCPSCGSTDHTSYHNVESRRIDGITPAGHHYNTVVWRRTSCECCGQNRIDRSYELRVAGGKKKSPQNGEKVGSKSPSKNRANTDSGPTSGAKAQPAKAHIRKKR